MKTKLLVAAMAVAFGIVGLSQSASALVMSDTINVAPLDNNVVNLPFNLGGPLANIILVELTMDPCNAFSNELPTTCANSVGTGEPVTVNIAGQSPVYLPANGAQIDLPLTQSLVLTIPLLTDLADGLINATTSMTGSAAFVDFTLTVTTQDVPEPGTLALFGLGLAGLGFARRRKVA